MSHASIFSRTLLVSRIFSNRVAVQSAPSKKTKLGNNRLLMSSTRRYQAGTVHYLNFDEFIPTGPEMKKGRAVVVVSPTKRRQQDLVIVVPISSKPPATHKRHTVRIMHDELNGRNGGSWAKCDMPATISTRRLSDYRRPKYAGQNDVPSIQISGDELQRVRDAMIRAIGAKELLDRLQQSQRQSTREALRVHSVQPVHRPLLAQKTVDRAKPRKPAGSNRPIHR